jgi:DNA-binding transcriptional ArsR family regulator
VIVVHLDARSLARVRLAVSPASEAIAWLRLTATGRSHAVLGDPGPAARFALRDPDVALLAGVLAIRDDYMPDLLTPKPAPGAALAAQLETIAQTGPAVVNEQLAHFPGIAANVRDAITLGTFANRAAGGLAKFWRHAIADSWPQLHDRMQADLAIRAKTMLTHGIGGLLGSLHSSVAWTGNSLRVSQSFHEELSYNDNEIVLSPSVLAWPRVLTQLCDPQSALLCYPASGVGTNATADQVGRLGDLVGRTRATLLRDLDIPRSTTDLSSRHQLAPATVSYHLQVLHNSGLVTRTRDRRTVLYRRTDQGDALHG